MYTDIDLSLTQHPISKELLVKRDVAAVKNAIKNLLMLEIGEKPFHREIYGGLRRLLFEQLTPELAALLKRNISELIRVYEPRAKVFDIRILSYFDKNAIDIEIDFSVVNFPQIETLNVTVERVR